MCSDTLSEEPFVYVWAVCRLGEPCHAKSKGLRDDSAAVWRSQRSLVVGRGGAYSGGTAAKLPAEVCSDALSEEPSVVEIDLSTVGVG